MPEAGEGLDPGPSVQRLGTARLQPRALAAPAGWLDIAILAEARAERAPAPSNYAATTFCSIAPKIEWPWASRISMRTVSPGCMKGVAAAPRAICSIMRISAMQE